MGNLDKAIDALVVQTERNAELETKIARLERVMYDAAHLAATLGSGSEGWMRGRFQVLLNYLLHALQLCFSWQSG